MNEDDYNPEHHVTKKEMIKNLAAGQVELEDEIEKLKDRMDELEKKINRIERYGV